MISLKTLCGPLEAADQCPFLGVQRSNVVFTMIFARNWVRPTP